MSTAPGNSSTSEGNSLLPAQDRPELTAGVVYDFDIIPVAGAVAGTYTLSGDIKFDRRALMMQGVTSTVADNVIQFRGVSTDTAAFWDKPKSAGERLYLRMTLADSGSSISILEDPHLLPPRNRRRRHHPRPRESRQRNQPQRPARWRWYSNPLPEPRSANGKIRRSGRTLQVQNILDNRATATDDSAAGYAVGSLDRK